MPRLQSLSEFPTNDIKVEQINADATPSFEHLALAAAYAHNIPSSIVLVSVGKPLFSSTLPGHG